MKLKNQLSIYLLLLTICFFSCNKNKNETTLIKKELLSGFVQKGPFINGATLTINELNKDMSQTGSVFNTQITDNKGSFEFKNIALNSNCVEFMANGFYFNEITGLNSESQLTLWAISDISDKSSINVNILTHLEKDRVKYLLTTGMPFSEAKRKASKEVLSLFGITEDISNSELLDLSQEGTNGAVLLAVSVILQANRSTADLSELLANISSDIKEDGLLDNVSLKQSLQVDAKNLDLYKVRSNIEKKFVALNIKTQVPDFETYVNAFIEKSVYGELKDIDGNVYRIKKIGSQWWMIDNLKTTRYANGDILVNATALENIKGDDSTQYYFTSPFMPPYTGTEPGYGYYYTLAATMHGEKLSNSVPSGVQGICPKGWHVPSDGEFGVLESYIRALGYDGIKEASEKIEFNLVLAGIRGYDFGSYAVAGYNWALRNSSGTGVGLYLYPEQGANCRCVKDY